MPDNPPAPGSAAVPVSLQGAQQLKKSSPNSKKTIEVKVDGAEALYMKYDEGQVDVTINFGVTFSQLEAATSGGMVKLDSEMFALVKRPKKPGTTTSPVGGGGDPGDGT